MGDNLPTPWDVVGLCKQYNIHGIRLYDSNQNALQALKGTNIPVIVSAPDPAPLSADASAAMSWVQSNIQPFNDVSILYILVGNELIPGAKAGEILNAMKNINGALNSLGLDRIKVTTAVSTGVLAVSYPPSAGAFTSDALSTLYDIVHFLDSINAPLLANIYPFFSYLGDPNNIPLDYALFNSNQPVVNDQGLLYQNLFDAIVDSFYAALEKAQAGNVRVVVSESGWPSDGGPSVATVQNAQSYVNNLINHVKNIGKTPRRPNTPLEVYIFAMFDEDLKEPHGTENHYGIFTPAKQPKYNLNF